MSEYLFTFFAEEAANQAIKAILEKGSLLLYESYLTSKTGLYMNLFFMERIKELLKQYQISCDQGEMFNNSFVLETWEHEEEPVRIIDRWQGCAIPKGLKTLETQTIDDNKSATGFEEQMKSTGSLRHVRTKSAGFKTGKLLKTPLNETLISAEELQDRRRPISSERIAEELHDDLMRKNMQEKIKNEMLRIEKEKLIMQKCQPNPRSRSTGIQKSTGKSKTSEYTYDYDSKLICVRRPNSVLFPSSIISLDYSFKEQVNTGIESQGIAKEPRANRKSNLMQPAINNAVNHRRSVSEHLPAEPNHGEKYDRLAMKKFFKPAQGVCVTFDNGTILVGPKPENPKRMKREDYSKLPHGQSPIRNFNDSHKPDETFLKSISEQPPETKPVINSVNKEMQQKYKAHNKIIVHDKAWELLMKSEAEVLESEILRNSGKSATRTKYSERIPEAAESSDWDRIMMYKAVDSLNSVQGKESLKKSIQSKGFLGNKIVEEFNEKNILTNNFWGSPARISGVNKPKQPRLPPSSWQRRGVLPSVYKRDENERGNQLPTITNQGAAPFFGKNMSLKT